MLELGPGDAATCESRVLRKVGSYGWKAGAARGGGDGER
jgi:hypothetical protein